jgi:MOSC domain-containing protein YiiM
MDIVVTAFFAGKVRAMPGDGRPTGIFKEFVEGPVRIEQEGLTIDAQADRRVHGGPEKAVHHFPLENHRRLAAQFPEQATGFVAGGLGENISTEGMTEENVCIGDVYEIGSVRLQVSQPRSPCWKIDARHGREGITRWIAEQGIAGWYYRVLQTGTAQAGNRLRMVERNAEPVSLRDWWTLSRTPRVPLDVLQRVADTPGLTLAYRDKVLQRIDWLRRNAPA